MDKYEVKLTTRAMRDLDSVYSYIAHNLAEPMTAENLLGELENQILSLEQMPYRCPERHTGMYANKGYRQLMVKNYTVIYRVNQSERQVIIVTVRYSKSSF